MAKAQPINTTRLPRALRQKFATAAEVPESRPAPPAWVPSAMLKDMNFKISESFHRDFKLEATKRGLRMNEFLKLIYQSYIQQHPDD